MGLLSRGLKGEVCEGREGAAVRWARHRRRCSTASERQPSCKNFCVDRRDYELLQYTSESFTSMPVPLRP